VSKKNQQMAVNPLTRHERLMTLARRCEQTRASSQPIDEAIALEFGWSYDDKARMWRSGDVKQPDRIHAPQFTLVFEHTKRLLPVGFRWRGGTCHISSEVHICPDHNDPMHRERLMKECPPSVQIWNEGLEVELRPGGDSAFILAFAAVCLRAHAEMELCK
jgi:hypothetical protein